MRLRGGKWSLAVATILLLIPLVLWPIIIWLALEYSANPAGIPDLTFGILLLTFPAVGWLIAVKRPGNPLGWIFLSVTVLLGIGFIGEELALRAARVGADSTAARWLILGGWFQYLGYWLLIGPAILLFPDGRALSVRFRWALWGLSALLLVWGVAFSFGSEQVCVARFDAVGQSGCQPLITNPLASQALAALGTWANPLSYFIFILTLGTSVTALGLRYLRSTGDVRQQIKWVAWVTAAGVPVIMVLVVIPELFGLAPSGLVQLLAFSLLMVGVPVAVGFSILKYRLYDIDRIISRTAAYAVIVIVLAAVYAVSVTLLQRLLPVQGQLGIVASTLVVAALFNPLRGRVQNAVDRRFNRSRYDAGRVLEEFSSRLRDDVDLEQMQVALLRAAQQTMQPSHLSLWIRERER